MRRNLLMAAVLLAGSIASYGGPKYPIYDTPVYLTPEEGGMDYVLQGEYVTPENEAEAWGAQVVAMGQGVFRCELFRGGLPGAGGTSAERITLDGERRNEKAVFSGDAGSGTADGECLAVELPNGISLALNKTVRTSPTLGTPPPDGALVLFDGTSADAFVRGKIDERGWLEAGPKTKMPLGDGFLHVEFLVPFRPEGRQFCRGNSGIGLMSRYEIQIIDDFGNPLKKNICGSVYNIAAPLENACFPPLTWQTFDIDFRAPRFDVEGNKTEDAQFITVKQNGILIHENTLAPKPTLGKEPESPEGPLLLQRHNEPVFFRNVWFVPTDAKP